MAKQNIFDNETFFEGYKAIRDREGNANVTDIFSFMLYWRNFSEKT